MQQPPPLSEVGWFWEKRKRVKKRLRSYTFLGKKGLFLSGWMGEVGGDKKGGKQEQREREEKKVFTH